MPKDAAYFRFWRAVALAAAVWGLSVLVLLGGIWYTLTQQGR